MSQSPSARWGRLVQGLRDRWEAVLASPGGPAFVARGIAAGAAAAMLPAFGLHLVVAAILSWLLRGSVPAAAATCLLAGNPLTHSVLVPLEYAIGRAVMPGGFRVGLTHAPAWIRTALPAAEEALVGGVLLALVAGGLAWFLASRALRARG
ncbi:DUF2062 domain-containing protein [Roseomonas sp. OT10]|uniref:DUF2062 domain-containing protein n=1 Tax=Roseomonas cutis TaxID=2897332 RepID=UPI001E32FF05|nr:DUF2062 domain-containing protein [Roseomonas sp. OT10]UFN50221.1 DUF2062 domain-containing protein [Roseomonas sp. OT10]